MTFESIIPFFPGEGNFFHKIFKLSDETGCGGCMVAADDCNAGELLHMQGIFHWLYAGQRKAGGKVFSAAMLRFKKAKITCKAK